MHAKWDYKWLNNWQFRIFIVLIGNRLNDVCLCVFVCVWSNCSVHCVSHHEMVQTVISKFKLFKGHGMYYCHHIFVIFPSLNNSQCIAICFQIISELFVLYLFILYFPCELQLYFERAAEVADGSWFWQILFIDWSTAHNRFSECILCHEFIIWHVQ